MTLGKKIKHFRNALNITQQKLSSLTKIHNVTIKKYETDALVPLPKQINRIAEALNVSPEELTYDNPKIVMQTLGDMYTFVITLFKSNFLFFSPDKTNIIINPYFKNFFDVKVHNQQDDTSGVTLYINNSDFLSNMQKWNEINLVLENLKIENNDLLKKKGNELTKSESKIIYNIEEQELKLERLEMELMNLSTPLNRIKNQ